MLKDEAKDKAKRQASWLNHPAFLWGVGLCLPLLCALLNVWLGAVLLLVNVALLNMWRPSKMLVKAPNEGRVIMTAVITILDCMLMSLGLWIIRGQSQSDDPILQLSIMLSFSFTIAAQGKIEEKRVWLITMTVAVVAGVANIFCRAFFGHNGNILAVASAFSGLTLICIAVLLIIFFRITTRLSKKQPLSMGKPMTPRLVKQQDRFTQQVEDWRTDKHEKIGSEVDIQSPNDRA